MIIDHRTQSSDGCLKYQSPQNVMSAQAIDHFRKLSKSYVRFRPFERNLYVVSLLHTTFFIIFFFFFLFMSIVTTAIVKKNFRIWPAYYIPFHILFIFVCFCFFIFVALFLVRKSFYVEQTQYTCSRLSLQRFCFLFVFQCFDDI